MDGVFDQACFSGIQLLTAPGRVMTPRPATERLVERAFARLGSEPATVADVGSGSGAIAIAIALRAPNADVWAADLSGSAVELTRMNVRRYGLGRRVHVMQGDLLGAVPGKARPSGGESAVLAGEASRRERLCGPTLGAGERRLRPRRWARAISAPPRRERVSPDGTGHALSQFRRRVLETARFEVDNLLADLEEQALVA